MNENDTAQKGCSNTPAGKSHENVFTSIDYFSFRFDRNYKDDPEKFEGLFQLLKRLYYEPSPTKAHNGYTDGLNFAPGINLYFGGTMTRTKEGFLTSFLEMKGEGCRFFEENNSVDYAVIHQCEKPSFNKMWIMLFDECIKIGGKCTRLDLPVDDCEGIITIEEIKQKIKNKEYTTRLRKIEETISGEDQQNYHFNNDGLPDIVSTIESKHKGYSATLGNRTHIQLCIYDKNAEQAGKARITGFKSWVRYETRFYHDNAHDTFGMLYSALKQNKTSHFIMGCLTKIFQLKQDNRNETINRSRNPIYGKWLDLTLNADDVTLFKAPTTTFSIDDNASWFIRSAGKTFVKLVITLNKLDVGTDEIVTAIMYKAAHKLDNNDLNAINKYLQSKNCEGFKNLSELVSAALEGNTYVDEIKGPTMELLIRKKSPKEIRNELEERKEEKSKSK